MFFSFLCNGACLLGQEILLRNSDSLEQNKQLINENKSTTGCLYILKMVCFLFLALEVCMYTYICVYLPTYYPSLFTAFACEQFSLLINLKDILISTKRNSNVRYSTV